MAVIAVYSIKGGVGKTTLAVDLAWRAAVVSKRNTLLWDLDPQGGAGFLLGFDESWRHRAASLFQREGRPRDLIEPTAWENLSLLRADDSLRGLPVQLARLGKRKRLAKLVMDLGHDFDRIVLDCPAGYNEITEQVLAAADLIIVPLPASPLAARALDGLRRNLLHDHHRHPPILPVLSMYDARRKLHRETAEGIAAGWPVVPMASQIEQTAVRRAPLGSFAASSEPGKALGRLWQGIEAKLQEIASARGHLST